MRTLEQVLFDLERNRKDIKRLEDNIEELTEYGKKLMSEGFKIKYGCAFGETFKYAGKEYILVNDNYVRQVNAKNVRRAEGIRDFFKGESNSPFKRKMFKLDGPLTLE